MLAQAIFSTVKDSLVPINLTYHFMQSSGSCALPNTPSASPYMPHGHMSLATSTATPRCFPTDDVATPVVGALNMLTPSRHTVMTPRSPVLSTCIADGCGSVVASERNACSNCRALIVNIIRCGTNEASSRKGSLSVSHTTVTDANTKMAAKPSSIAKQSRKLSPSAADEPFSPDALYFGRRTKRQFRAALSRAGVKVAAEREVALPILLTSSK
ncbi:hypothetical protein EMMF5_004346 [Cystobasidiomycetes sp. EMM_F5]